MNILNPLVSDDDFTLVCGDALDTIVRMPSGSVDAIVTSPPYADARSDYEHVGPDEYADWFGVLAGALWAVLKPQGGFMLNLGRVFRAGEELSYVDQTVARIRSLGWKQIDSLVWTKPNGRPVNPYLTNQHEFVYWFAKETSAYRGYGEDTRRPYAPETLGRYQRRYLSGVKGEPRDEDGRNAHPDGARPGSVFVAPVGKAKGNEHPAPMALELACYLVALSCPRGGTVLDPFAGSGTTSAAARHLGRKSIAIEIDPDYARLAADRLSQQVLAA